MKLVMLKLAPPPKDKWEELSAGPARQAIHRGTQTNQGLGRPPIQSTLKHFPLLWWLAEYGHFHQGASGSCSHMASTGKSPLPGIPIFSDKSLSLKAMQLMQSGDTEQCCQKDSSFGGIYPIKQKEREALWLLEGSSWIEMKEFLSLSLLFKPLRSNGSQCIPQTVLGKL